MATHAQYQINVPGRPELTKTVKAAPDPEHTQARVIFTGHIADNLDVLHSGWSAMIRTIVEGKEEIVGRMSDPRVQ